jgi:radical SAM protein with 4Fe4S-binding SPASM domain
MLREGDPTRAASARHAALERRRNSSGVGIANIDFNGNVHADQFSMYRSFGNVKQRQILRDLAGYVRPDHGGPQGRPNLLKGRCADCRFKNLCGGSLRAPAEITTGDPGPKTPAAISPTTKSPAN